METPIMVALIAAGTSLLSMFCSVFVAAWAKRRSERIDERHAQELANRTREAEQLRLDRAEQWARMREEIGAQDAKISELHAEISKQNDQITKSNALRLALEVQLEEEQRLRRLCQRKMEEQGVTLDRQDARIRELERRHD